MPLFRSTVSETSYPTSLQNTDIRTFDVYTTQSERLGQVNDVLIDHAGRSYLGMDVGFWETGKQVLLPLERCQIQPTERRVMVQGLMLSQLSGLPTYNSADIIDRTLASRADASSRPVAAATAQTTSAIIENSAPLEASLPLEADVTLYRTEAQTLGSQQETRTVAPAPQPEIPSVPTPMPNPVTSVQPVQRDVTISDSEIVQLLGERIVVDSHRRKVGEVIVRKEIETQIVEVPVRREKLIIEQISPERKQLVSLDLGQQSIPDILLSDRTQPSESVAETAPLEVASRFLAEAAKHQRYKNVGVRVQFGDPALQSSYQQWLDRYHSTQQPL